MLCRCTSVFANDVMFSYNAPCDGVMLLLAASLQCCVQTDTPDARYRLPRRRRVPRPGSVNAGDNMQCTIALLFRLGEGCKILY